VIIVKLTFRFFYITVSLKMSDFERVIISNEEGSTVTNLIIRVWKSVWKFCLSALMNFKSSENLMLLCNRKFSFKTTFYVWSDYFFKFCLYHIGSIKTFLFFTSDTNETLWNYPGQVSWNLRPGSFYKIKGW